QGIARRMLDILINDAKERGIRFITLEATRMGRPLYESAGFASEAVKSTTKT
ncbi:MAG: GNAT family N-acetyltransferase, partial [Bacteroidales bacterium]|nr:GNAT family N-acetyltransferase [Bacteroidales bacterium]